jgi:hypothetical protein
MTSYEKKFGCLCMLNRVLLSKYRRWADTLRYDVGIIRDIGNVGWGYIDVANEKTFCKEKSRFDLILYWYDPYCAFQIPKAAQNVRYRVRASPIYC